MEHWKQILASSVEEDVSILDADVTGIKGISDTPDGVFYSEFTEEDAISYRKIFTNFSQMYALNDKIAISGLNDNLEMQNQAVSSRFCPVELMLYSSRCVGSIIASDEKVFKLLRKMVCKYLSKDALKITQYILGGWEWKTQIAIFIEAIALEKPDLIKTAIAYYPQMAELCADDDKSLLKSYVNMIFITQNETYINYFPKIVVNDVFMNDTELIGYFCTSLSKNPYWKKENLLKKIIEAIENKKISPVLRRRLEELKRQRFKQEDGDNSLKDMLNSKSVSYENKVELANKIDFSISCAHDIYIWENIDNNVRDACELVNRRGMENIDNIYSNELRGRAYIALATHAKFQREEISTFLLEQKESNPIYRVPINIALYDLHMLSSEELFGSLFAEDYQDFYGKNLGKYFRYNKPLISSDFMSYLKRNLKPSLDEDTLKYYLMIIHQVLEQFNSKDGKIADKTHGIANGMMKILMEFEGNFKYSDTYNSFIDILCLIANESPSNRADVLKMFDKFKHYVSVVGSMISIEYRINSEIKRFDGIAAPQ